MNILVIDLRGADDQVIRCVGTQVTSRNPHIANGYTLRH
jgi:hypothetical protein